MINKIKTGAKFLILFSSIAPMASLTTAALAANMQPAFHSLQLAKLGVISNSHIYSPDVTKTRANSWDELSREFLDSYNKGNYLATQHIAKKSLDFAQREFGRFHQNTADALNKMGIIYETLGELDVAKTYYEESLTIFEQALGKENAKVAMVLNNLGNLFYLKKGYEKSEQIHLQSLLMRQHIFSTAHPTVARSAYNLGRLYEKQSKHDDAIMFYRQAAVLWKKTLGPRHLNIANTFNNLANVYAAQGHNTTAEEFHLKALTIREANLGPDHIEVAESLFNLGTICTKQEKYDEAESFYREALNIMEKSLEINDPQIAMTLYSLANIYHIQAQKEHIYSQEIISRLHITNTIEKATSSTNKKNNIVIIQLRFRKDYISEIYTKAEPLYRRAINIVETHYGSEHPSVKVMKDELAMMYINMESSVNE